MSAPSPPTSGNPCGAYDTPSTHDHRPGRMRQRDDPRHVVHLPDDVRAMREAHQPHPPVEQLRQPSGVQRPVSGSIRHSRISTPSPRAAARPRSSPRGPGRSPRPRRPAAATRETPAPARRCSGWSTARSSARPSPPRAAPPAAPAPRPSPPRPPGSRHRAHTAAPCGCDRSASAGRSPPRKAYDPPAFSKNACPASVGSANAGNCARTKSISSSGTDCPSYSKTSSSKTPASKTSPRSGRGNGGASSTGASARAGAITAAAHEAGKSASTTRRVQPRRGETGSGVDIHHHPALHPALQDRRARAPAGPPASPAAPSPRACPRSRSRTSRAQAARRASNGCSTLSMPSRLTPRKRNGITFSGTSTPAGVADRRHRARYFSCLVTRASIGPPTASMQPAQVSDSSARVRRLGQLRPRHDPRRAEPAQIPLRLRPPGHRRHLVAEPRQQRHRHRPDPAGRAGHQHRPVPRRQPVRLQRHHRQHRGQPRRADRHRLTQRQPVGQRHQPVRLDPRLLGIAAPVRLADPPAGQHHRVAGPVARIVRRSPPCRRSRPPARADSAAPAPRPARCRARPCSSASNTRRRPSPRPPAARRAPAAAPRPGCCRPRRAPPPGP